MATHIFKGMDLQLSFTGIHQIWWKIMHVSPTYAEGISEEHGIMYCWRMREYITSSFASLNSLEEAFLTANCHLSAQVQAAYSLHCDPSPAHLHHNTITARAYYSWGSASQDLVRELNGAVSAACSFFLFFFLRCYRFWEPWWCLCMMRHM